MTKKKAIVEQPLVWILIILAAFAILYVVMTLLRKAGEYGGA